MQISNLPASNSFSSTDVLPIEINGVTYKVTGATLAAALQALGNYLTTENVANNLTATAAGSVLDARQGKALNDKINATQSDIAIIIEGNQTTHTGGVAVGQYVIVRNSTISGITDGLYKVVQAIPANTAITSAYLTAVDGGGLNAVNSRIATLIKTKIIEFSGLNNSDTSKYYIQLTSNAISTINDNATTVLGAYIVYWTHMGYNIMSLGGDSTSTGLNGPLLLLFSKGTTFTGGAVGVMFVYM